MIARLLIALSLAAGLSYPLAWGLGLPVAGLIAWKGCGVGLLAAAAAVQARDRTGWLLAAVMGFGALGDVLLDLRFEAGMAAFALGHVVAIWLYRREARPAGAADRSVALTLLAAGAVLPAVLLPAGDAKLLPFTVYSLLLCAMAASAWLSRFPRPLTGFGALLFVVSDALIAVRIGMPQAGPVLSLAIWLLYYLGQLLIFTGVSRRATRR